MATNCERLEYDHWSADWLDVTELQTGYEVVFAAKHREHETFVTLVPVPGEERGALNATRREGCQYRRVVRARQGAPAVSEHTTTYGSASKQTALEKTHQWLEDHSDGLGSEVTDA
jgi:hypothetical protein